MAASNNTCSEIITWSAAYKAATSSMGTNRCLPFDIKILRRFWREERARPMDKRGNNILHFLAIYGNVTALREFLQVVDECLVTNQELRIQNVNGDTPLHEVVRFGHKEAAEIILGADSSLALVANHLGETSLYVSAAVGAEAVFTMLARYDSSETTLKRNDGCTILHAAVMHEHYVVAIKILKLYPQLARTPNRNGITALNVLATKQHSFRSASPYRLGDLGLRPVFIWQFLEILIYFCIPTLYEESKHHHLSTIESQDESIDVSKRKRYAFVNFILGNGPLASIDDAKQRHILSVILARRLITHDDWDYYNLHNSVQNPLIEATKFGITDLVREILHVHPEAAETCWDDNGSNIFHIAAKVKNRFLYEFLLKNVLNKNRMLSDIDYGGNTVMHYAATRGGHKTFPHGPRCQKRIQYCTHPSLWNVQNDEGVKAIEQFERNHSTVREDAERTIRDLANYGLILATLIATVNYAAIFTVPGGFDQNDGVPIYKKTQHLHMFRLIILLGVALAASVFNIAGLLAILNTNFDFDDFYIALPIKSIIVFLAMFVASTFTMLAGCQALLMEFVSERVLTQLIIVGTIILLLATWLCHLEVCASVCCFQFYLVRHLFSYKTQYT